MGFFGPDLAFSWTMLRTPEFNLRKLHFAVAALAALACAGSGTALASKDLEPGPVSREQHAKELLGRNYKRIVKSSDRKSDIEKYVKYITSSSLASPKKWKKYSGKVAQAIMEEAARYGFDPIFLVSVIQTESSFNPLARGTSGEIGLMQLMPDTAKWIAEEFDIQFKGPKTLENPVMNVRIGAAYLSLLREKFGSDSRLYLPAYNMGPAAVKHAVKRDIIPADYARRVMKKYLRNYEVIRAALDSQVPHVVDSRDLPHSPDDNS